MSPAMTDEPSSIKRLSGLARAFPDVIYEIDVVHLLRGRVAPENGVVYDVAGLLRDGDLRDLHRRKLKSVPPKPPVGRDAFMSGFVDYSLAVESRLQYLHWHEELEIMLCEDSE